MVKNRSHQKNNPPKRTHSTTLASDRKARRKQERHSKKRRRNPHPPLTPSTAKSRSGGNITTHQNQDFYHSKKKLEENDIINDDDESIQSDDEEIRKTVETKQQRKRRQQQQSQQQYGTRDDDDDSHESSEEDDPYEGLDEGTANLLRSEDAEIYELERKLGLSSQKNKSKLKKEYSKLEGFGDDFVDFLDDLDDVVGNVLGGGGEGQEFEGDDMQKYSEEHDFISDNEDEKNYGEENGSSSDDEPEELVPMKDGSPIRDYSSDDMGNSAEESEENMEDSDVEEMDDNEEIDQEKSSYISHADTYRPTQGEDIYGNKINKDETTAKPAKYIPPHLRKKMNSNSSSNSTKKIDEEHDSPHYQQIRRTIRGLINRLSDSTLEPTLQSLCKLYQNPQNSSHILHQICVDIIMDISISNKQIMTSLVPLNACLLVGMHHVVGKSIGAFALEQIVLKYEKVKHDKLGECSQSQPNASQSSSSLQEGDDASDMNLNSTDSSKAGSNLMLLLCYFYNFHLCHCTLLYDLIRLLLDSFHEIDVEVLLLILHHAGKELRSDDPSALKDIVLLAKDRAVRTLEEEDNGKGTQKRMSASRIQFMLDAMTDLKNNKKSRSSSIQNKQMVHMEEKIKFYRKFLGHVKSNKQTGTFWGSSGNAGGGVGGGLDGTTLRITLQDIQDIPTKGRWWKTGASWVGHQHHNSNTTNSTSSKNTLSKENKQNDDSMPSNETETKLLQLAASARMNTDLRRSIFCIILSSSDCEDAYTKLLKQQILQPQYPEVCRVLVECCLRESNYNPFYTHLGIRICEYQKKCKRALSKVVSDVVQRFQDQDEKGEDGRDGNEKKTLARQAANLAKVTSHWLREGILKLKVLETSLMESDFFDDSKEGSNVVLFFVMLFHTLFDSIGEKETIKKLFAPRKLLKHKKQNTEEEIELLERDEELRRSISVFLVKFVAKSPKNTEGSSFYKNFKIALKLCKTEALNFD